MNDRQAQFPIQSETINREHRPGFTIPWSVAEVAYSGYEALFPSSAAQQSLERLAERGGFGQTELLLMLEAAP